MQNMPRPRKPYVTFEHDRHGNPRWYYRRGKGKRYRLPGKYESKEWLAAYKAADTGETINLEPKDTKSLLWLCKRYYASAAFQGLKPSTQTVRKNTLDRICQTGGEMRFNLITKQDVAEGRDRRASTPAAALNYVKILNYLFEFAVDVGYMETNPAKDVKKPKQTGKGLEAWAEQDVIQFLSQHKIGSMPYLAMSLFLWAGLSRSDAYQIGPQHVKDDLLVWDREKTGVPQYIPIVKPLRDAIDACPTKHLAFLVTGHGRPFKSAAALGNKFAEWCSAAGVNKRAHGLRKLSATLLAENQGTHSELRAVYGWKSDTMPSYYTRTANAKKLAENAAEKLSNNILSPHFEFGDDVNRKAKN